ncbi:hypothetical protein CYMTET_11325 [Cymbomonas tetramitiformis]|uniref:Uncharacterized protein n=1 Tax=Cymbomonas tetramitiformis TaxID=36881 RepID=A0AAE0GMI9_9CHLO|nr:hypothetical protein CYMTET_11325 [Cymbomonas tetramitiformis]
MAFIEEFLRHAIKATMEKPEDRDAAFYEHITKTTEACAKLKSEWEAPTKTWGFWKNEKNNGAYKYQLDPSLPKLPGRRVLFSDAA